VKFCWGCSDRGTEGAQREGNGEGMSPPQPTRRSGSAVSYPRGVRNEKMKTEFVHFVSYRRELTSIIDYFLLR